MHLYLRQSSRRLRADIEYGRFMALDGRWPFKGRKRGGTKNGFVCVPFSLSTPILSLISFSPRGDGFRSYDLHGESLVSCIVLGGMGCFDVDIGFCLKSGSTSPSYCRLCVVGICAHVRRAPTQDMLGWPGLSCMSPRFRSLFARAHTTSDGSGWWLIAPLPEGMVDCDNRKASTAILPSTRAFFTGGPRTSRDRGSREEKSGQLPRTRHARATPYNVSRAFFSCIDSETATVENPAIFCFVAALGWVAPLAFCPSGGAVF